MFAIMKPILYCESCGNIIGVKIRKVERTRRECCNSNSEVILLPYEYKVTPSRCPYCEAPIEGIKYSKDDFKLMEE